MCNRAWIECAAYAMNQNMISEDDYQILLSVNPYEFNVRTFTSKDGRVFTENNGVISMRRSNKVDIRTYRDNEMRLRRELMATDPHSYFNSSNHGSIWNKIKTFFSRK